MTGQSIRLLVIEDSSYMLMAIRAMVKLDAGIEIVGEARDGVRGVEMALALQPDVITMDVNMPGLNGIEATRRIMQHSPTAIIMLSSMTERGLLATGEALAAGAIDYIPKTMSAVDVDLATIAHRVAQKIRFWGEGSGRLASGRLALPPLPRDVDLLVIAGGTGSPLVISGILADLRALHCPALVALDILDAASTAAYVEHLGRISRRPVREAQHNRRLEAGMAHVVPGGRRAGLQMRDGGLRLDLRAPTSDLLTSVHGSAASPQFVFLSGAERDLGELPRRLATKPTTLWVQCPETCAQPALPEAAAALGMPILMLRPQGAASSARTAA